MLFLLQSGFLNKIEQLDQWLFVKLNSGAGNPVFDNILPYMRVALNWAPLYLFLVVFVILNFRIKGLWWSVFFVATVALTDMTGTYAFKRVFERLRPCNDPEFYTQVRLLVDHCSPGYSFISNHAANHFGIAAFFYFTMRPVLHKNWAMIGFVWAALVAYSQIYVGIHYPFDVLAGSLLGLLAGTLTGKLFNKRFGFVIFENQSTLTS
jgi:membrane-associated phospholipid phosphatase